MRDLWINLLYFLVPTIVFLGHVIYIAAVAGLGRLTLLAETAQFPLYFAFVTILSGIVILLSGGSPKSSYRAAPPTSPAYYMAQAS